ncbi:MAG: Cobyrinic acid ac-diamide synthase [Nevskia sp.]|nr:Cobyrinic acid ac-diamide synthase [Nevskia sp.]
MKTIVITSQKGGSGKTTLTAHLAVEAGRSGAGPVCVIDMDKQATLSRWHDRREEDSPERAPFPFHQLAAGLAKQKHQGTAICFIDTAPTISDQSSELQRLADLVLIPVRPSPADLWAVAETVRLVKQVGKPFLFIMTQAKAHANITAQTVAALSGHGRIAQSFIADRVAYAVAMTGGRTAPELAPKGAAADEIAALWTEVQSCIPRTRAAVLEEEVTHG